MPRNSFQQRPGKKLSGLRIKLNSLKRKEAELVAIDPIAHEKSLMQVRNDIISVSEKIDKFEQVKSSLP
jgi:hypothetical protein